MVNQKIKSKKGLYIIPALNVLFLIIIGQLSFPSSDDIYVRAFRYRSIIDMFNTKPIITDLINVRAIPHNGRYLSNTLCYLINRSTDYCGNIVRGLALSLVAILLYFAVSRMISNGKCSSRDYLTASAIMIFPPAVVYAETYTWIAGSMNYLLPVALFIILYNYLNKDTINKRDFVAILLISFANMLIIEHISIMMLMVAFFLFVNKFTSKSKIHININDADTPFIIGSVLGGIIMFTNKNYIMMFTNFLTGKHTSGYQSLGPGKVTMLKKIMNIFFYSSGTFYIIIPIIAFLLIPLIKKVKNKPLLVMNIVLAAAQFILYSVYYVSSSYYFAMSAGIVSFVYMALAIFIAAKCMVSSSQKAIVIFFLSVSLAIDLIFIPVSPTRERGFYIVFFLLILVARNLYRYMEKFKIDFKEKVDNAVSKLGAVLAVSAVLVIFVFSCCNIVHTQNDRYIKAQMAKGETTIVASENPFGDKCVTRKRKIMYFHHFLPEFDYKYSYYYKVPGDIEFKIVSYSDWSQNYYKVNK